MRGIRVALLRGPRRSGGRMQTSRSQCRRFISGWSMALTLGLAASAQGSSGRAWEPVPGLVDVRYEGAREVGDAVRQGSARIELAFPVSLDGRPVRDVVVGPGWITL